MEPEFPKQIEPADMPLKILAKAIHLNVIVGARRRNADLADTETDIVIRWALDTVCCWVALTRACASMGAEQHASTLADVAPNYELLVAALRGNSVLIFEDGKLVGEKARRGERKQLVDWLI
jgi:hypothetical protein